MTQLVLPQSIDASTEITATEHQQNYVAIRDLINGQLEGGSGASGNIKADGITAREVADEVLRRAGTVDMLQEGVVLVPDLKVTPGAGLQLAVAAGLAYVTDDSAVVATGARVPVIIGSPQAPTIGANSSGNPRIDQIILTTTGWGAGTVSVLQGTATGGATLDNRTGAAALPNSAIRLADILMPTGFAGPFVQNTHIRDRRQWARGAFANLTDVSGDLALGAVAAVGNIYRIETGGGSVRVRVFGSFDVATADNFLLVGLLLDGAQVPPNDRRFRGSTGINNFNFAADWIVAPAAGSHTFQIRAGESAADVVLNRTTNFPLNYQIEELLQGNSDNAGA